MCWPGATPSIPRRWRNGRSATLRTMPGWVRKSRVPRFWRQKEAACVAFRKHTLLPLDDCLYALQSSIPTLTRSSLHRLFQRHNISRLPEVEGEKPARKKFAPYPIGYFHIDIAEVRTEEGKLYLFVAIDRTSKFAYAELLPKYGKMEAAQFLRNLIATVPYKIHTILTDNGIPFTHRKTDRHAFLHIFDPVCLACRMLNRSIS